MVICLDESGIGGQLWAGENLEGCERYRGNAEFASNIVVPRIIQIIQLPYIIRLPRISHLDSGMAPQRLLIISSLPDGV
jgi:hypothetical protein